MRMDNSKSIKFNLNKVLLKVTSLVVIGAFCISTTFVDLVWAYSGSQANSYLRPYPARKDFTSDEIYNLLNGEEESRAIKDESSEGSLSAPVGKDGFNEEIKERNPICKKITFLSDGFLLKGILHLPAGVNRPPVVIGSHGIFSSEESPKLIAMAEECNKNGIGFFRFSHRGRGESEGIKDTTSFSARCEDLRSAIKIIQARNDTGDKIGLFGSSMGGAVCLSVASMFNIEAIVTFAAPINSGFLTDAIEESDDFKGFKPLFNKKSFQFDISNKISKIHHILIVHGGADNVVPPSHARKIYKKVSKPKRLIIQRQGNHIMSDKKHQEEFIPESANWFKMCFDGKDYSNFKSSMNALKEKAEDKYTELKETLRDTLVKHKFSTPQSLVLYAEPLLDNCGVVDLEEALGILLKNNVLGEVILYAENPVYNEILGKLIKDIEPELNITKKTKEELGLDHKVSEVNEVEALLEFAGGRGVESKDILCVIKGITKDREALEELLKKEPGIPAIVLFEDGEKAGPYSLLKALEATIGAERIIVDWPQVEIKGIEKEYKEYKEFLRELSGA